MADHIIPPSRTNLALAALYTLAHFASCSKEARNSKEVDPQETKEKLAKLEEGQKPKKNYVTIGLVGNPKTFNPILADDNVSQSVISRKIFLAPMKFDEKTLELVNEAQEALTILDGGRTFRIRLRGDLVWGDGVKASTKDLLFTLGIVFDDKIATQVSSYFRDSKGKKPITTLLDEQTVEIRYEEPRPLFRNSLPHLFLLPAHLWEKSWREGHFTSEVLTVGTPPEKVVGLGPFRLKRYAADQRIVLERNPHFPFTDERGERLPYLEKLYFLIVSDFNTAVLKIENGELDLVHNLPPAQIDYLKRVTEMGPLRLIDGGPANYNAYLILNQRPGKNSGGRNYVAPHLQRIFAQRDFRRALSHAIDRDSIVRNVLMGRGTPLYCLETPANPQWHFDCPKFPYNLDEARRLLDELGLKDRNGDGIREDENGNRISFTALTNAGNKVREGGLIMIQDDLKKVGIEMKPGPGDFNYVITTQETSLFEARHLAWGRAQAHPIDLLTVLLSSGRDHMWNPKQTVPKADWEKRLDPLAQCTVHEMEETKQRECYREATRIFGEEQPITFLYSTNIYIVAHKDLGNVVVYPFSNNSHYNAEKLFWKQ